MLTKKKKKERKKEKENKEEKKERKKEKERRRVFYFLGELQIRPLLLLFLQPSLSLFVFQFLLVFLIAKRQGGGK